MYDKVSKIPISIADTRNITNIKIKRKTIILEYENKMHFSDETTDLTEYKKIILSYPKMIKSFEPQVDENDNLFLGIIYRSPFKLFEWILKRF